MKSLYMIYEGCMKNQLFVLPFTYREQIFLKKKKTIENEIDK